MLSLVLAWRLDLLLFAVIVAALGAALFWSRKPEERKRIGARIAGAWLVIAALTGVLMELNGKTENTRIRESLSGYAPSYARMMVSEGIEKISLQTSADDFLYLRLIELQKQWLELNPAVNDIYTFMRKPDGSVVLLIDSETDYDRDGSFAGEREGRTPIGEPYEASPAMLKAFEGRSVFDGVPYTDPWGTWVSAFHPLRGEDGSVIGVLGVDYDASRMQAAVLEKRLGVAGLTLVILLIALFSITLKRYSSLVLVLVFGMALSSFAAWRVHVREDQSREQAFRLKATERINWFMATLKEHLQILTTVESFYASSPAVDRDGFKTFTRTFLEKDQEIKSLQWVPRVDAADRASLEAELRTEGYEGFEIKELDAGGRLVPAAARPDYYPVIYTEPVEKNRILIGYDHGADPVRRAAILKARETGAEVVTPGIFFENGRKVAQSDVLILKPFFSGPGREFTGILTGVFNIDDLLQTSLQGFDPANMRFDLSDVTTRLAFPILSTQDSGEKNSGLPLPAGRRAGGAWQITERFRFCDRSWELTVTPVDMPDPWRDTNAWITFASGFFLTLGLAAYLWMLLRHTARYEQLAERSRSIVETANDAFITIDSKGDILDINHNAEVLFGWPRSELIGKSLANTIVPHQFRDAHRAGMLKFMQTGAGPVLNKRIEISALHRTKGEFPIELTIWPVRQGPSVIFSAFIHDISDRKAAEAQLKGALDQARVANEELKRTQTQLIQADRLSAIGQLAAGIAHEINNPIGFVNSNLSTLGKYGTALASYREAVQKLLDGIRAGAAAGEVLRLADEVTALGERLKVDYIFTDIAPLIQESQSGLDRVKKIIIDLKTFVRADSKEGMDLADLNQILESAVGIVWNELKYKAEIVKELQPLPKINCNPQQIGQVFINMLVNAAQAIPERGTITVRTRATQDAVEVEIEDTGEGIPAHVIDHIFDPFFTTKEVGKGTGLGLGISYDIVKKHNGRIEVSTQVGQGTKFTVFLPISYCSIS